MPNKKPVHCIVIEADVSKCALENGSCMWQDTAGVCKYSPAITTVEEYCEATGNPIPTEEDEAEFKSRLKVLL